MVATNVVVNRDALEIHTEDVYVALMSKMYAEIIHAEETLFVEQMETINQNVTAHQIIQAAIHIMNVS